MELSNLTATSQALSSYAAQLQSAPVQSAQASNRTQEERARVQTRNEEAQTTDRVTLSAQSTQSNRVDAAVRAAPQEDTGNPAATPEAANSAASKSVTRALEAYVQTALI